MRVPLAVNLESRDGGTTKDAKGLNAIGEVKGEGDIRFRKRPGVADLGSVRSGTPSQLLYNWNGVNAIIGDHFLRGTITTIVSGPTDTNLSPSNASLQWQAAATNNDAATPRLMFKNRTQAKYINRAGTVSAITYASNMGAGTYSVISITRSSGTATVTLAEDVFNVGDTVTIAGAVEVAYNGAQTVLTVTSGSTTPAADITISSLTRDNGAILNSADKDASITLSNINRTATGSAGYKSVRGNVGKSSGKWYWEVTSSSAYLAGIGKTTASLASYPGSDANGNGVESSTGNTWTSGGATALTTAFSANEVVGFVLDMDAGTLALYRSGALVGNIATGLSGTYYPMIAPLGAVDVTANFGATAFTYTVPSGCGLLASTSATAKAVTSVPHGLTTSTAYTIAGANQSAYNGSKTITVLDSTSFTYAVTTTDGGGTTIPITITRSGTTATATMPAGYPALVNGSTHTIAGAGQSEYNGSKTITVTGPTTFTYTVTTSPATPATGSPAILYWFIGTSSSIRVSATRPAGTNPIVTVSTPDGNNLSNGDQIKYSFSGGTSGPDGTGPFTVANRTASSFTFQDSGVWGASTDNITVYRQSPPAISSITRSGTTATITTGASHNFGTYDWFTISGAAQSEYNLSAVRATVSDATHLTYTVAESPATPATGTITVDGDSPATPATGTIKVTKPAVTVNPTFTYTVAGSPSTPATGTITAAANGGTVPGIPYINGYFCVMDVNGVIWHSASDDPSTWAGASFTTAQVENGAAMALAESMNYLIAFKQWSTEPFYDAQNPSGSVFSAVQNGFTRVGCAQGFSVAEVNRGLAWIAQTQQEGRSVYFMLGLEQQKISTPDIDRILNADDLATVYAYGLELDGHPLYLLTLVTSNITIVYDFVTQLWCPWSSYTLGSSRSVTSITRDGDIATAITSTAHGLSDGDPALLAGATQNEYNGIFQTSYVSPTSFQFMVSGSPTTPATGTITVKPYTESYFKFTKAMAYGGATYFLHETDGHLYKMLPTLKQDAGLPINWFGRTTRMDGGDIALKRLAAVAVIGDSVDDVCMIRWSDDDCQTFSAYRFVDLSADRPVTRKCGAFRRRTIEFRHIGNTSPALAALELDIA